MKISRKKINSLNLIPWLKKAKFSREVVVTSKGKQSLNEFCNDHQRSRIRIVADFKALTFQLNIDLLLLHYFCFSD